MPTRLMRSFLVLAFVTGAASAQAEDENTVQETTLDQPKTAFSLTFDTEWHGTADFDTGPGDISITRLGAAFGVRHSINQRLALRFGASVEHSVYDFSGATGFVMGTADPFDDVTISTISLGLEYAPNEADAWFVGGFVRSSGESGSDFGDTINGGVRLGYQRVFNDTFSLGAGVALGTELEGDLYAIPLIIVDWKIAEKWRLLTSERAAIQLRYQHSDTWTFGLEGGYERREFRLDESGPLPSGVVDERRIPFALFATYTASPNFIITGRVGTSLWTELEFSDRRGNKISDDELDAVLGLGVAVTLRF